MPSVAQQPIPSTNVGFMFKEKHGEPLISGFTAVNGRTSPTSPRKTNGVNGMNSDTIVVRPLSRRSSDEVQEQKVPLPIRDDWNHSARPTENGLQNGHKRTTPPTTTTEGVGSPVNGFGKRRRSSSQEEEEYHSHNVDPTQSRRRLDSYKVISIEKDISQNNMSHNHSGPMENARDYPPMERHKHDRSWAARDPRETVHNGSSEPSHRDHHGGDGHNDSQASSPDQGSPPMGGVDSQGLGERSSTTEITRAGVQVDPKKRKRQFANRTKTGCGTCRRRKKKCDEAKPECNNCTRGGFICEGYAHKVPWPKNSVAKTHIPLQAKDKYAVESPQLYHNHGHSRDGYSDQNVHPADGARVRPIVVEEHERQAPRNGWNGWTDPPRASYPPEHPPPTSTEYSHPPAMTAQARPQSHDHHVEHAAQSAAPQRQSVPRIYHHTPQTMSQQTMANSPTVTAQLALQHQSQGNNHHHHPPHHHQPMHPSAQPVAPGPRQPQHAPPPPAQKPQKSEKEKMLNGEYYVLFDNQLVDEREQCKAALYRFNSSSNPALGISREERARHFRTIIEAPWTRMRNPDQLVGTLGQDVHVDAPFTCEYGYNIHVGDAVVIGSNCTILDSCRVSIGSNTIIGPNVSIFSNTVSTDPNRRNGSKGTAIAKGIEICDNVFIGGNVTILPGIKVGKGATIGAGSVVTRNVPPHVVVSGNPATVRRGIWKEPYN